VKKRYVQKIDWKDGVWIDEPDVKAKGFELARSDTAVVTSNVQRRVFDTILTTEDLEAARQSIYDIVKDESDAILDRETPLSEVAVAKGMNDPPESYGSTSRTPQPHYRGAKYANKHIEGEHITAGTKVKLLYVNDVHGLPKTYTADTKEDGDRVDAIAVEDIDNIADIVDVDREKMVEKTIEAPLRSTFRAFEGWGLQDAQADTDQGRLENFM
jgi:DNA polymerase elongation subunit (family B)